MIEADAKKTSISCPVCGYSDRKNTRKAGPVVPVDVAPNEPPRAMRWLREKPVPISTGNRCEEYS